MQTSQITKKWWKESVIYQIYPRSFQDSNGDGIGDLKGITQRLDYLKELGVDIIWLSPIFDSPNADNGYDIRDYRAIMKEFGTMEDFDLLLKELKKRSLRIILDLVPNHSSDEHAWFVESRKSKDNPYRDYYIWKPAKEGKAPNNWVSFFSGSAWDMDEQTQEYYLHLFAKKQPDLNWDNPKVRQEIYGIMKFWLDKGIDGWRMDVIPFISKDQDFPNFPKDWDGNFSKVYASGPKLHEYSKEMNQEVLSKYDVMTVGEGIGLNAETAGKMVDERENELSMIYHFEHLVIDRKKENLFFPLEEGFSFIDFKAIFSHWDNTLGDFCWNSILLGNHDFPRMVSRFANDQEYRVPSSKLLAMLLTTMKGTPYIYQGDELGMTNTIFDSIEDFDDIQTKNAYQVWINQGKDAAEFIRIQNKTSRDHARTPMQWDDSANGGFTSGKAWLKPNSNYKTINAAQALLDKNSTFYFFKNIIGIRKENPTLIYGDFMDIDPLHAQVFAYTRIMAEERFLIVLNFSSTEIIYKIPKGIKTDVFILGNYDAKEEKSIELNLLPYEARLYKYSIFA